MTLFADPWTANTFELSLLAAAFFGLLGIALLALCFKVFEGIPPKLKGDEEVKKGNVAVGIMVGALLLGISLIVGGAAGARCDAHESGNHRYAPRGAASHRMPDWWVRTAVARSHVVQR